MTPFEREIAGKVDVNLLNLKFEGAVLALVAPETVYDSLKVIGEYRDLSFVTFAASILVLLFIVWVIASHLAGDGAKR